MNIYENLQIVWSQFVTDMLLFVSIRSTSNIYWFIRIRIRCQWIQTNSYSVTFDIHTIRSGIRWTNPKVKKQLFTVTYLSEFHNFCHWHSGQVKLWCLSPASLYNCCYSPLSDKVRDISYNYVSCQWAIVPDKKARVLLPGKPFQPSLVHFLYPLIITIVDLN
jgi:hypothetical protein